MIVRKADFSNINVWDNLVDEAVAKGLITYEAKMELDDDLDFDVSPSMVFIN